MKTMTMAEKGQRWLRLGRTARVMAVVDGWVMYRFPQAAPHCMWWRYFEENFRIDLDWKGKKK